MRNAKSYWLDIGQIRSLKGKYFHNGIKCRKEHCLVTTNYFYISDIHFGYQTDTNPIRRSSYNLTFSHYKLNGPKDYDNRMSKNWNAIV